MATLTINANTPANGYTDQKQPSALDIAVTNSTSANLPDGLYDAWCLDPFVDIKLKVPYNSVDYEGTDSAGYGAVKLGDRATASRIDQLQWILAQNFAGDPKYAGQYNYGEVQAAIWETLGFTNYREHGTNELYLTNRGKQLVQDADIKRIQDLAKAAVANGDVGRANGEFFTVLIDPEGDIQPIILQLRTAKLGDYVWEDKDLDGLQDANESGIDGVTVKLLDAQGSILATTTTGDDPSTLAIEQGFYQFTGLKPGNYRVEFVKPADFVSFTQANVLSNGQDTIDSDADSDGHSQLITLAAGESNRTIDAGLVRSASLGDRAWLDRDGDGRQDDGEAGVANVRVLLCDAAGNPTGLTATTDEQGNYLFSNLTPGTYSVKFELPPGYEFTKADASADDLDSDANIDTGKTGDYTLGPGESNLTVDAGLVQRAHLGDRVWEDTDADGQQDMGEQGIANVKVKLLDANGNIITSTTTDGNGIYGFDVLPGTYSISIEKPNGFLVSPRDVGADDADSDIDGTSLTTQQVTLDSGDNNLTLDAGLYRNAELGNRVWLDADGDGRQDEGEAGIANVRVVLCDAAGKPTGVTTTDDQGNYIFRNLTPGTYSVKFDLPVGYEFTKPDASVDDLDNDASVTSGQTDNYALNSGESNLTVDAGLVQRAHLGDRVWEDTDADGQQDMGEQGIANVKVNLLDANGNIITSTTTDGNGIYGFDVLPGTYSISIEKPSGFLVSPRDVGADDADSDIDATTLTTQQVTLQSGDNNLTVDAGLYRNTELGDRVWLDADGDGRQDASEAGVANVRVLLCDAAGKPTGLIATTDDQGNYLFSDLTPGTYSVKFELPAGYLFTKSNASIDDVDSDADTDTGKTGNYTLSSGESNLTVDAGLVQLAHLGDRVWEDADADGRQDSGEQGIANVKVNLVDANGNIIDSTTTESNGIYGFDVLPGTYSVVIEKPADYRVSPRNIGTDDLDSDIDSVNLASQQVTLQSGDNDLTLDAGLYRNARIGDRVWLDRDGDGQQDVGEAGVANVTVHLRNGSGVIIATTSTDANGNYLFDELRPGTYSLQFVAPAGYEYTQRDIGDDGLDSDASRPAGGTATTVLSSGESDRTWDAGLYRPARLGDRVWEDADADGIQDAAEQGISGVTVNLRNGSGVIVRSTTTDNQGFYHFDVPPGTWSVSVVPPAGYTITRKGAGSDDAIDSDIDAVTRTTHAVTLASGNQDLTLDAGLYRKASLGDRVWLDRDGDGRQDDGEAGVAGVRVLLFDANGNPTGRTAVTDPQGNYLFSALDPGTYSVKFELPTGYRFTKADATDDSLDSDANTSTGKTGLYTLSSGQVNLTADAGLIQLAHLGDRVWEDSDADGIQDAGEQGIAQVKVFLKNAAGDIVASTTTDANGIYGFDVLPGIWSVSIERPTGYRVSPRDTTADDRDSDIDSTTLSTPTVTLQSGDVDLTLDAGLYRTAELGDRVWLDLDADGQQDANESGVAGVRVLLCDANGNLTGVSTVTNPQGQYLFTDLLPGTYSVKFVAPAGYSFTRADNGADSTDSDANDATGKTGNYTLASGERNLTVDAGLLQRAHLGDRIWEDTDADGIQDTGERGIANVRVQLRDANGQIISSTSTDVNGLYGFDVAPGTYSISIEKPAGYFLSPRNIGADDSVDSDLDPLTLASHQVTLNSGDNNLTLDGGLYRKASIGDRVWVDRDHDNLQDANEPGIANVKVSLQNQNGATLKTTFTDSNGYYLFADLDPGVYRIVFDKTDTKFGGVDMSTWRWTKADIGSNDQIDGDAHSKTDVAMTAYTTLESGEIDRSWDVGVTPLIIDMNGDGVRTVARADSLATFDLLGNGSAIRSGWVSAEDALLAVDNNGNGSIDSIHELFGGLAQGDGFNRLQTFDSNHDGWVDMNDNAFAQLRVWQDANGNHVTDAGELRTLAEAGIAALRTSFIAVPAVDAQGNLHLERGSATFSDGHEADMTDVYFSVDRADSAGAGVDIAKLSSLFTDDRSVDLLLGASGATHANGNCTLAQPPAQPVPQSPAAPESSPPVFDSLDAEIVRNLLQEPHHT